ncbi:hypothetical protein D3C76_1016670 [compost metagenome]
MPQLDAVALVIAPQRQQHVRHHHHQRRALGQLLVKAEQDPQRRNRDQPAANTEQATQGAQASAQHDIHQPLDHQPHVHLHSSMPACYPLQAGGETHSSAQWLCVFRKAEPLR